MKRTQLRSDPAKTAAFHARGRAQGLARGNRPSGAGTPLKRAAGLKRARPRKRARLPADVRAAVLERDSGLCVWTRHLGHRAKAEAVHHLLPRGVDGWPEYTAVRENLVALAALPHLQHEHSPCDRLPWAALPAECQAFLRAVAADDARAARFVRVKYPGSPL